MFDEMMNSRIQVLDVNQKPIGDELKAIVEAGNQVLIFKPQFKIEEDYFIKHFLPFGDEIYRVVGVNYCEGMEDIPPMYEVSIKNIKSKPKEKNSPRSVVNHIQMGNNSRLYQDSEDSSVNDYSTNSNVFQPVIEKLREQIKTIHLDANEKVITEHTLDAIQKETEKEAPSIILLKALFSMFPTAIQTLAAGAELASMVSA